MMSLKLDKTSPLKAATETNRGAVSLMFRMVYL